MKHLRVWMALATFAAPVVLSCLAGPSDTPGREAQRWSGGSYLTIIKDSNGIFASRSVITLHADHTISAMDSGEGGPAFFFTSQRGSWKPSGSYRISARMIDFSLPPASPGIARADYVMNIAPDFHEMAGTITVTVFPLQDVNPPEGQGTQIGTFTFVGQLITP